IHGGAAAGARLGLGVEGVALLRGDDLLAVEGLDLRDVGGDDLGGVDRRGRVGVVQRGDGRARHQARQRADEAQLEAHLHARLVDDARAEARRRVEGRRVDGARDLLQVVLVDEVAAQAQDVE
ncbi:unnamed protein product, partial [Pelagomonas calceolata]